MERVLISRANGCTVCGIAARAILLIVSEHLLELAGQCLVVSIQGRFEGVALVVDGVFAAPHLGVGHRHCFSDPKGCADVRDSEGELQGAFTITHGEDVILRTSLPYFPTFGGVETGAALIYLNSVNNVSLAINQGSFAAQFEIQSGPDWSISLARK